MKKQKTISSKSIKWIAISLIVLILFGMFLYPKIKNSTEEKETVQRSEHSKDEKKKKELYVDFVIVRPEVISEKIYATGSLLPDEEVDLMFESSGKLTNIYFEEGTLVKKGDLLAKINDLPLQAQLKKLTAQLPLAENRVFRQKTLLEKDAVSQEAFEQVSADLDQLRADIEQVKAQIKQTELRAPFDGYIGLRMMSEGSYISTNTLIAHLTKMSPMKIDFSVSERYASHIKKGTKVKFKADGSQSQSEATVYALDAMINKETHTRDIRAIFPNNRKEWMPGTFVSIEILLNEISEAIAIPSQALIPEMGIDKVFLYKSGKAEPVKVISGLRTDSKIQIISGLNNGDTLITSGMLQLRTGMPVILNNIQ